MEAVLLARVSSKEQQDSGYSLPAQEKLLTEYAKKRGFNIVKIFAISESASGHKQRQIFNQMVEFVKKRGIKIIICEKADRLTRNFKDMVMIDEWLEADEERQVHLVKDSLILHRDSRSQEKLNWGIRILFAKNYIDNLSEEVKKGQKEKIAEGGYPSMSKLGYKTIGEQGKRIHVLDEDKSPLVKKAFELAATGNYSLQKLVGAMYETGLRSIYNNKVVKSTLARMLSDVFYIGKFKWLGEIHKGSHPALITPELFSRVQAVVHRKGTPKYSKHSFLFKGLIACGFCGGQVSWETKRNGHIYGHCNHYRKCPRKPWDKEKYVEDQLLDGFKKLELKNSRLVDWIRRALKESHGDEIVYHQASAKELQARHDQLQRRLDTIYEDKLDGKVDKDFYDRKFKQYTEEKEHLFEQLQKHSQASDRHLQLGENIYELSQRAKAIYLKGSIEQRRRLINLMFRDLKLKDGVLKFEYTKTFELLAQAVGATNDSKINKNGKTQGKIFEHAKHPINKGRTRSFDQVRPMWLPLLKQFRTVDWKGVKQELEFSGVLNLFPTRN